MSEGLGVIIAMIVLGFTYKVIFVIVVIGGSFLVKDSAESAANLSAIGSILGFGIGAALCYKAYKYVVKPTMPTKPAEKTIKL